MIATFRANGRRATVRHLVDDGLHGALRAIGWSFALALAILLLIAPTTAKAADPDAGGSLLGGLTGGLGLGEVIEPVGEVIEPVAEVIEPLADPLLEPILDPVSEPILDPIVEPVGAIVDPLLQPVAQTVEPVTELLTPVVEPVTELVGPVVEPVIELADPVLEPLVDPILQPVVQPIVQPVEELVALPESVVEDVPGATPLLPSRPSQDPVSTPAVAIELPQFIPILPDVTEVAPVARDLARPRSAHESGPRAAVNADRTVFDVTRTTPIKHSPAGDPGTFTGPAAGRAASISRPQAGPIGTFNGLGSGHALSGLSLGVAIALGFLLLFLLPPPFRVSRLHLAAVFWRPQRFFGPLVPPG